MTEQRQQPADWQERQRALDISRSWIVQAPAGSGKTELLVQRILALLAIAESPEEILAITFTRKAAAEMKTRLLQALESAANPQQPMAAHAAETWRRARKVLARDRDRAWRLRQNPSRLQMMTIDSFCALLTRRMPWLSRFGDPPKVSDEPEELYLRAAEALLARLESGGPGENAIAVLLDHLDNRYTLLRDLLVTMLGRRDQWLRHLMAQRQRPARELLESGLRLYVASRLDHALNVIGLATYQRLCGVARYAAGNLAIVQSLQQPLAVFVDDGDMTGTLAHWQGLSHLVLTGAGTVRKTLNKTLGFPADKSDPAVAAKAEALDILETLRANPQAIEVFKALRHLPDTVYQENQWQVLQALIKLLPLAEVELQNIFCQQGAVDFIQIAGGARAALGTAAAPEDLLLQLDGVLRHVLVDEFQDTSYAQYDLLRCLTSGWQAGDGRSLFLVGDPMQSIYRFREAEVGLFLRVSRRGLDDLPIDRLILTTNFRSGETLVAWVNQHLQDLVPAQPDEVTGAVPFAPSIAYHADPKGVAISLHGFRDRQDEVEAAQVVELIRQAREVHPSGTIAVLVRSRSHLLKIIPSLQQAGLRYQAQDIDPLTDRPAIQDILSLVRALHHLGDRVAWLAILRAPWCGLTLTDLDRLCGRDGRKTIWELLTRTDDQIEMFDRISADGRQRLHRIMPILERALDQRGRISLRRLIESTWLALSGPACVSAADMKDVQQVMVLLEGLDNPLDAATLENRVAQLFAAPDPGAGSELQLMTIHRAKGLEFDTVILPGLGRGVRTREKALLRWLEHPKYELLLAPIPSYADSDPDPTYAFLGHVLQEKDALETLRLLYVAVTRARSRLHLLGHVRDSQDQPIKPASGSLLAEIWPSAEAAFTAGICSFETSPEPEAIPLPLRRLPAGWQPPSLPAPLAVRQDEIRLASETAHYDVQPQASLRTEEGRVIGTLVHGWLERIAGAGMQDWSPERIRAQEEAISRQLCVQGVPRYRLAACVRQVLEGLLTACTSERGQWLLTQHADAACELALNGVVDGQMVRAVVDRTFEDEGIRWVVDYKTSRPGAGESTADFLQQEVERYRPQLAAYAILVGRLYPDRMIRTALYFPMIDGWIVSDMEVS
ncbi:MAG: UvrD-helicase domain-containing protein [Desulfuromonadales bacterium]